MATFTTTLPDGLLKQLAEKAKSLSMPKNKLLENALQLYLDHLERAEYVESYQRAANDDDTLTLAEENLREYLQQSES